MITDLLPEQIEILLHTQTFAHLGCHAGGKTYVVPITYVYDQGYVYCHTNPGRKIDMMRENPEICLEIDQVEGLSSWRSVIAWGRFEELAGTDEARALDLIFRRLGPSATEAKAIPTPADDVSETMAKVKLRATKGVTFRVKLVEKTGRYERIARMDTKLSS